MRDDFSDQVKRVIAARTNYRCSNPECRAFTSGPQVDPAKSLNVGVAAHITAASPGGPRYNPELTSEQRSHAVNAIWLCQNCAKLVDNDETRLDENQLKAWKRDAEGEALARIGKTATETQTLIFPRSIFSNLRSLGQAFVGRAEELKRIHLAMAPAAPETAGPIRPIFVLEGIAGIGKTQLLKEYCLRFGSTYQGGIFWIQANTSENHLWMQHREILQDLGIALPDSLDSSSVTRALQTALVKRCNESNVLVIVDDVPEPTGDYRAWTTSHWLPVTPTTPILVSARTRISIFESGATGIFLGPIPRADAIRLLQVGISLPQRSQEEWGRIADWVSCHPLALELINRLIVLQAATLDEILEATKSESPLEALASREALLHGVLRGEGSSGLDATFQQSYLRLTVDAQQLARTISFLAPAPIPIKLLKEIGEGYAPHEARAVLATRCLISSINESDGASIGFMHPLVADFVRRQETQGIELWMTLVGAISRIIRDLDLDSLVQRSITNESTTAQYLAHAEYLFWRIIKTNEQYLSETSFMPLSESPTLFVFLLKSATADDETGQAAVHQLWLIEQTLDMGEDLSALLARNGALDRAVSVQTVVAEHRVKIRGEKSRRSVTSLDHLGLRLSEANLFDEAVRAHEQAIRLAAIAFGEGDRDLIIALDNLGTTLRSSGKPEKAVDSHILALTRAKKHLGLEDPDTITCASNLLLACLPLNADHTSLSDAIVRRAVELVQEIPSNAKIDHRLLRVANNLAVAYLHSGNLPDCERFASQVLTISEKVSGRGSVEHINSLNTIVALSLAKNEFDKAYSIMREALELSENFLGKSDLTSLSLRSNLGYLQRRDGRLVEACETLKMGLGHAAESVPLNHPTFQRIREILEATLIDLGRTEEAKRLPGSSLSSNDKT